MTNYVKYIDENTIEFAPLNKDGFFNYNTDVERMTADGYLPLKESEMPTDGKEYKHFYEKKRKYVEEIWEEIEIPFEQLKENKKNWVKTMFNLYYNEYGYCTSSLGFVIDATLRSKNDVQGLIDIGEEPITFRGYDNVYHENLTLADMETLKKDICKYGRDLYEKKWLIEAQIDAATTKEELDAITW